MQEIEENQIAEDVTQKVEFNVKSSVDVRKYEGLCCYTDNSEYYLTYLFIFRTWRKTERSSSVKSASNGRV